MIYAANSVITQNDARDILERGAVAVEGTRIADVGALADVQARRPGDRVLDLGEAVIMPGLVNGHTHIPTRRSWTGSSRTSSPSRRA